MRPLIESVTNPQTGAADLRGRRSGIIEVMDEHLVRIVLRPWAKRASWLEARVIGRLEHSWRQGNVCRLYYHQPRSAPSFLALSYVVSTRSTTLATFRATLGVLDQIARIKRSDALLCDVSNARISDRLLKRWGWTPLQPRFGHRNFIKRFYGDYPPPDPGVMNLFQDVSSHNAPSQPKPLPAIQ